MTARGRVEEELDVLARRLIAAERDNEALLKVAVAVRRLGASMTARDALAAIREIVINVIGSEDFAVYLLQPDGVLGWISGMGCYGGAPRHRRLGEGVLGRVLGRRTVYMAASTDVLEFGMGDEPLAAVVPLLLGDKLRGAIAIFRLLPHREPLSATDGEVLWLLATQGAAALAIGKLLAREPHPELGTS